MRVGSLVVLGSVFVSAFVGRAAVLAAKQVETPLREESKAESRCINGAFAEELATQSARIEKAAVNQKAEDQKRAVLLDHVNKRITELELLNAELSALSTKSQQEAEKGSSKIASLYERMKPDLAGVIIGEMDPKFAAGLLRSMNSDAASSILAAVDPARAYAITVLMAEPS